MKLEWFKHLIMCSFLLTLVLELIAIYTHQYTISDFVLANTRWPVRAAFCLWLFLHLVCEYWRVYK